MIAAPRQLSPREREILRLLDMPDATVKSVARLLGISENTAETHKRRAFKKLNVHRYHDAMREEKSA